MGWKPKIPTVKDVKQGVRKVVEDSPLSPVLKPISEGFAKVDSTNPESVVGDVWQRGEETLGGRKKEETKEAEKKQEVAADNTYKETGGVLDQMKGNDDEYLKGTEAASNAYKDTRNKNMSTYTDADGKTTSEYKKARDASNTNRLAGDKKATEDYRAARNPVYEKFQGQLEGLSNEAASQANDATQTYKNNIQPRLQDIMDTAQRESGGAMSLKDAGDPNNSVNKAWRDMYEGQAQGVGKQALADVGVMNALGAQATANQLGGLGGALPTSALIAMQGQNMSQSGQAYARAQQQMQGLREQGLETGRIESQNQYERGQGAKDRYAGSVKDYAGADSAYQDRMAGYRGERGAYADRGFEVGRQRAGEDYDIDQNRVGLEGDISMGTARDDLGMGQRANQMAYEMGDRRGTEDLGFSAGQAGLKHSLGADQGARQISNINQKYGTQGAIAGTQAQVGYQQQIAGPQILGGLAGAGVRAYAGMPSTPAPSGQPPVQTPQPSGVGSVVSPQAGNYDTDTQRRGSAWGRYT